MSWTTASGICSIKQPTFERVITGLSSKCGAKPLALFFDTTEILEGKATVYRRDLGALLALVDPKSLTAVVT